MDGVVISEAERSQLPAILSLLEELFSQEQDFTPNAHKQAHGLLQILDHAERGRIFLAHLNNEVIGMANALFTISTAEGGPVILLEDVIVAQPFRCKGVGALLIQHVLCWGWNNGFLRVTLLTDPDNAHALRLYERNGFVRSGMLVLRLDLGKEYMNQMNLVSNLA